MASRSEDAAPATDTVVADDGLNDDPYVVGDSEQEILDSGFILHSDIPPSSKQLKKENPKEEESKENKERRKENNLKSSLLISGALIAVIGALVALAKKTKKDA